MYQRPRYHQPRRQVGKTNYVMPFLIIICIGIIGVLVFNLWRAVFPSSKPKAAYLHIVNGSAQMKAWGTESFFNLSTDSVVMQGDRIRSSADAKFIVEFYDGTLMRIGGNADLSFDTINDQSDVPSMDIHLFAGDVWFDMMNKTSGHSDVKVTMNNIVANSNNASIFELENQGDQVARVIAVSQNDGLSVDVLDESGSKVVESEKIGVGQEINFKSDVLKAYWAHQSPTVLAALADDFKQSEWYLWNIKEDDSPTVFEKTVGPGGIGFVKVAPQVVKPSTVVTPDVGTTVLPDGTTVDANGKPIVTSTVDASKTPVATPTTPSTTPVVAPVKTGSPAESTTVSKPEILSIAGGVKPDASGVYKVTSRVTTLSGTIKGADKVVVNGYTLTKFKAGSTSWSYFANADFGLMKAGDNIYEIYGLDANGKRGESIIIHVYYTPQAATPNAASAPAPATTTPATVPTGTIQD
ncbi:MAG: hypothetical protein NTZ25_04525 [Candidatus Peregrinibacteria bacterium]|nr:hypothetical protein [Candidatus Peregrinibacteria bacterium]